jgi:hypothetical protein
VAQTHNTSYSRNRDKGGLKFQSSQGRKFGWKFGMISGWIQWYTCHSSQGGYLNKRFMVQSHLGIKQDPLSKTTKPKGLAQVTEHLLTCPSVQPSILPLPKCLLVLGEGRNGSRDRVLDEQVEGSEYCQKCTVGVIFMSCIASFFFHSWIMLHLWFYRATLHLTKSLLLGI